MSFSPCFWAATDRLILELHEMIKVPHAVAYPMGFNLRFYRG